VSASISSTLRGLSSANPCVASRSVGDMHRCSSTAMGSRTFHIGQYVPRRAVLPVCGRALARVPRSLTALPSVAPSSVLQFRNVQAQVWHEHWLLPLNDLSKSSVFSSFCLASKQQTYCTVVPMRLMSCGPGGSTSDWRV
jgi:hypothetical protein